MGETHIIDRIRRARAQREALFTSSVVNRENQGRDRLSPYKFYQKGICSHKLDHESNGHFYLHVCSTCFAQDKNYITQLKFVGMHLQKNEKALQKCSATCKYWTKSRIVTSRTNLNQPSSN